MRSVSLIARTAATSQHTSSSSTFSTIDPIPTGPSYGNDWTEKAEQVKSTLVALSFRFFGRYEWRRNNHLSKHMSSQLSALPNDTKPAEVSISKPAIADGERSIRIPFGEVFACRFEGLHAGSTSVTSTPRNEVPKEILALAEGIRRSLLEVHQRVGHRASYDIEETTLQLPNSDCASRHVAVVQVQGEALPEDVRRSIVERFFQECFTAKYVLQEPAQEYVISAEEVEAIFSEDLDALARLSATHSTRPEPPKRLEVSNLPDLERLVAEAVAEPAVAFARANAGRRVKCKVITPAGDFDIQGTAARPETKWEFSGPITLVRQIDGLGLSDHKVKFAMPNVCFGSGDDRSGNGPETMPDSFTAAIGKGEGSDVPPEPLLTQIREFIGANTLLVRIRVEVIAVGSKIGFQLVHMEREVIPEYYELTSLDSSSDVSGHETCP